VGVHIWSPHWQKVRGQDPRTPTGSPASLAKPFLIIFDRYSNLLFDADERSNIYADQEYLVIRPLIARLFCIPATSAPVERVFLLGRLQEAQLPQRNSASCSCPHGLGLSHPAHSPPPRPATPMRTVESETHNKRTASVSFVKRTLS